MRIIPEKSVLFLAIVMLMSFSPIIAGKKQTIRKESLLEKDWLFYRGDITEAYSIEFDDSDWKSVVVPHDWAIYGPFGSGNDAQSVAILQNGEKYATYKTGRTGGLPYTGVGWYRLNFNVPGFEKGQNVTLLFDGAMSEANVYVNGEKACYWPYGYNSFYCDVTSLLNADGKNNVLAVRLENLPESSRWYPGAGLYRNVHLIVTNSCHIRVWGTQIVTSTSDVNADVSLTIECENYQKESTSFITNIYNADGKNICSTAKFQFDDAGKIHQQLVIEKPELWSPESPSLYKAITQVIVNGETIDDYSTTFGVRTVRLDSTGFYLNNRLRKFRGVCLHHDLGPLGTAVNRSAIRHQISMLKEMGCDAIRTSHNMPAPELVELCDEMGMMLMVEPFDEWDVQKCKNGYHRFFKEWAEKDMRNMLRNYRNHASVVMWSIGNEVPTQGSPNGAKVARFLQDICHQEDPTRPVTCGMDRVGETLRNGFASVLDVPGLNYRVNLYKEAYQTLPQKIVLGSETASTISSRGVYKFPVIETKGARYPDQQCSSYDVEACSWSNIPDLDFSMMDDYDWTIGQFVWTGFDYLGEPTPYDSQWPNHSSMFGIIDLASIPKDRYYLYRSVWRSDVTTIHILPHWNWSGREGEVTPIFVYTNYPSAELFVNGKSYGRRSKNNNSLLERYRLMWTDVTYQPGTVKVIVYDSNGEPAGTKILRTAGAPDHIVMDTDHKILSSDGKDLSYITVSVVDKEGNLCPTENSLIRFSVKGAAEYCAVANGDPTCVESFQASEMHLFNGRLTVIVKSSEHKGSAIVTASADGFSDATLKLKIK